MPWAKGQSGNNNGRPPATVTKVLRKLAQAKREDGQTRLEAIVKQLLKKAENGELEAIKYVCDRLGGRPAQAVEVSGDERRPLRIMYVNGNQSDKDADGSDS